MRRAPNCSHAALRYAERGVAVFPCVQRGKRPLTQHGFRDASADADFVRAWWTRWPEANIGVPTGLRFDVLDIDPKHGGDAALAALEAEQGPLPETAEVRTGGGGRHILFLPDSRVRCSAGMLGNGLDVRGAGGYVVAPPSIHASGRRYAWACRAALAPWPEWLLDRIAPREPVRPKHETPVRIRDDGGSRHGLRVLRRACETVVAAGEGTRHDVLRRRARTVGGFIASGALAEDFARACLLGAALEAGLPEREAERTVAWALTSGAALPLAAPERWRS